MIQHQEQTNTSTLQNPSHIFSSSGTYDVCLTVTAVSANDIICRETFCRPVRVECPILCELDLGCPTINLLKNGDFESAGPAFLSSLALNCDCAVGTYCIGSEPRDKCTNSLWIDDLFDHTFGTPNGHFMIVDGLGSPSIVWEQPVNVVAGNKYLFSFWVVPEISTDNTDFPEFDMAVNGVVISSVSTAGSPDNKWSQYCAEWVATTTGIVLVRIDQTGGFGGFNDYGIDDIKFETCLENEKPCLEIIDRFINCIEVDDNGNAKFSYQIIIQNFTNETLHEAYFLLPNGNQANPGNIIFSPPIPPLGTATLSTVICGGKPGEEFCFRLSVHNEDLTECCVKEICITVPCDSDVKPPCTVTENVVCVPPTAAGTAILTICNNGSSPKTYNWTISNLLPTSSCPVVLATSDFNPSSDSIVVLGNSCETININVFCDRLLAPGKATCANYGVTVECPETGHKFECNGIVSRKKIIKWNPHFVGGKGLTEKNNIAYLAK